MLNHTRYLHAISPGARTLLPSGTASNEALHANLNGQFRSVRCIHRTTLALRLEVIQTARLLAHNHGLYRPSLRSARHAWVMARSCGSFALWDDAAWRRMCAEDIKGDVHAQLLSADRDRARMLAVPCARKRPAGSSDAPSPPKLRRTGRQHRTPFTLKRATKVGR